MKFYTKLTDRTLFAIDGKDSISFLQNLITCDVNFTKNDLLFGALLTPQGKIIFEFYLSQHEKTILIDIAKKLKEEFVKHITLYKLRAQITLQEINELHVFAEWGDDINSGGNDARLAKLGNRIYAKTKKQNATLDDWHQHRTTHGVPELLCDFESKSIFPHFAMYDKFETNAVDFNKGCYIGQEVVSRMYHKTEISKRFMKVIAKNKLPKFGEAIFNDENKQIGTMGGSYDIPNGKHGLALMNLKRINNFSHKNFSFSLPTYAKENT